jgi:tRNA dimethylallyltransferase
LREIEDIIAHGKIPLLVGGTMLYFRVLQQGLAPLPRADQGIRAALTEQAQQQGWQALHASLQVIDPSAASRISPHDSQRIQRALEVYMLTGKTISSLQAEEKNPLAQYQVCNLALMPQDRSRLHTRIAERFREMLEQGFIEEVKRLYDRGDLTIDLPSIRSVGYRQMWTYLSGLYTYDEMQEKAIAATRQLAKRQMTWIRSWPEVTIFDSESNIVSTDITNWLSNYLTHNRKL